MKKKIDERILNLLSNISITNERAVLLIVGDRPKEQIPNLHYILCQKSSMEKIKKPNILWCYKKELDLSSHQKKNLNKKGQNDMKGDYSKDNSEVNSFSQFINFNKDVIKQIKYDESQKILGKTFDILILQDFEAITPNLLCRTIETVSGGGMIIFLFKGLKNLKQIYGIYMDFYNKIKTSNFKEVDARFNQRFLKSLIKDNKNFLAIDDEMNVLEISKEPLVINAITDTNLKETDRDLALNALKKDLINKKPIGSLVENCLTLDQAKCVMQMVDSISEKSNKTTFAIFSGRGRGKSSAMGIAVGSAFIFGYSSIYVTAPSPENLQTFFEFVVKSIEKLGYVKKRDYEILLGQEGDTKNLITNITIFKNHKQTIKYFDPMTDVNVLSNCELLVIDEAAAIPLNTVKKLMSK